MSARLCMDNTHLEELESGSEWFGNALEVQVHNAVTQFAGNKTLKNN